MHDKKIISHPTVQLHDSLQTLCTPLLAMGIDYFTHVRIFKNGGFSALSNNCDFHIHYLQNQYYNCDIHLAENNTLGDMIVWDCIQRGGESDKMVREANELGVSHLFTLVNDGKLFSDYFHFASSQSDETINQLYISQRDWLWNFTRYFSDKVKQDKALSRAWKIQFGIEEDNSDFGIVQASDLADLKKEEIFPQENTFVVHNNLNFYITPKEYTTLYWLNFGKTAEEIALICQISASTVRKHIENIKSRSGCYTLFQLGALFTNLKHR